MKRKYLNNGAVLRYISSIAYLNGKDMEEIYGSDGKNKKYKSLSANAKALLNISVTSDLFKKTYLGGNKWTFYF